MVDKDQKVEARWAGLNLPCTLASCHGLDVTIESRASACDPFPAFPSVESHDANHQGGYTCCVEYCDALSLARCRVPFVMVKKKGS